MTIKGFTDNYATSSSWLSFSSTITPTTPVSRYTFHNQNPTFHSQMSLSQLLCGNNINQSEYDDIDSHLHDTIRDFPPSSTTTITTPIVSINTNTINPFHDGTTLPLFLSRNTKTKNIDNWDLIRAIAGDSHGSSFTNSTNTTTNTPNLPIESYIPQRSTSEDEFNRFQHNCIHINEELLKEPFDPFDFPPPPISPTSSTLPLFVSQESRDQSYHQQNQNQNQLLREKQHQLASVCTNTHPKRKYRSRKKKTQTKMVVQVPLDEKITTRCWRKYGQKLIKGSPYPRGYYRCSIREGCLARKRVEQKKSDPDFLIITYTGEHNHPPPPDSEGRRVNNIFKCSKGDQKNEAKSYELVSPASNRSMEAKMEDDESKDTDNYNVSTEVMDDNVFDGLDDIVDLSDKGGSSSFNSSAVVPDIAN